MNIQKFPKHWKTYPFSNVIKDVTAGNPKVSQSEYLETGILPIIDQGQAKYGGFTNDLALKVNVEIPAIIFGDHTRVFKYLDEDFCLGADGVKILEPHKKLNKKFLFYYLSQLNIESAGYSRHFKFLKEKIIPIPSKEEQNRITDILDKADAIRSKRQQAIQLADQFLRSVFLEMFGDLFTDNGYKLSKKKTIGEVTTYIDYRGKTPEKSDIGIPLITAKNVKKGYIFEEPKEYIPVKSYDKWMTRGLPLEKDILFTTEAPLGNVALLGKYDKVAIGQRLIALRSKGEVTHEFLMYALLNPLIQGLIDSRSSGSTAKGIRAKELYQIEIPIPNLELQKKFSLLYIKSIQYINRQYVKKSILESLFDSLNQKAFTGNL